MININQPPTYNELVELSNGQLSEYVKEALEKLTAAKQNGEDTTICEKVYWAFQEERLKRMDLGKSQRIKLPPVNMEAGSAFDQNG